MRKKAEVSHEVFLSLHYLGFTRVRRSASCVHVSQKGLKPHNHSKVTQNPCRKNTFYVMKNVIEVISKPLSLIQWNRSSRFVSAISFSEPDAQNRSGWVLLSIPSSWRTSTFRTSKLLKQWLTMCNKETSCLRKLPMCKNLSAQVWRPLAFTGPLKTWINLVIVVSIGLLHCACGCKFVDSLFICFGTN